jgi:RHS repeat-associated protein
MQDVVTTCWRACFTGKGRDSETGLDYFGARYFSSAQGRFMSPDWSEEPVALLYADLGDPQTLNLYAYVRNNPLVLVDPDGHQDEGDPDPGDPKRRWLRLLPPGSSLCPRALSCRRRKHRPHPLPRHYPRARLKSSRWFPPLWAERLRRLPAA